MPQMYKRCEGTSSTAAAGLIIILMYYNSLWKYQLHSALSVVKSARKTYRNMAENAPIRYKGQMSWGIRKARPECRGRQINNGNAYQLNGENSVESAPSKLCLIICTPEISDCIASCLCMYVSSSELVSSLSASQQDVNYDGDECVGRV